MGIVILNTNCESANFAAKKIFSKSENILEELEKVTYENVDGGFFIDDVMDHLFSQKI